jgi:hypothetical protein
MKLLPLLLLPTLSLLAQSSSVTLNVQTYSGNGPANLVSNAIPFKRGALTNARNFRILDGSNEVVLASKVLAVWPQDNSIRSILVQFVAPSAKAYQLQIGVARTTVDASLIPVTWDLPVRIFTLPASYLSDSQIFWEQKPLGQSGFPSWDSKQINYYSRIETVGTSTCANTDQYYDSITSTYQLYARTGDLKYLVNGRRWALHHRRDQIYLSGSLIGRGRCSDSGKTRYTFPQGLVQDYFMFGDEEAKRVSGLITDNFYMTHEAGYYYIAPNTRGWWTEREPAFALIGLLAHYEATNDPKYLAKARERVTALHRMQIENNRRAWVHNLYDHDPSEGCSTSDWGSSPWMSGLLLEGVIKYHKLTGEAMARESVLMAVDDLRARYVATGDYAGRSFKYLGCSYYEDGTPDLDNLIAHAFGYAYKLTGNTSYKDFGTAIFNTSVADGYTGASKQYNQQFRSSGHFVAYLSSPTSSDSTPPTVSLTAPTAGQTFSSAFTASASASDNVGVAGVRFLVDGQAYGAEDTTAPYSVSISGLSAGSHTVAARARDAAGNQTTSAGVPVTIRDTVAPTVSMTAPTSGQTVSGTINATANASDAFGVAGVRFLVDGQVYGAEDTSAPYAVSVATTGLSNGAHTIAARARDAAGNVATSAAVSFNVNNTTAPPSATHIRINAGGSRYTDPSGYVWAADAGFNTGVVVSTTAAIAGTQRDPLYQAQRSSTTPLTYRFTMVNGNYTVGLNLAEIQNAVAGQRQFHIDINGARVATSLDIYARAGAGNTATRIEFPISVTNGIVQIVFTPVRSAAMIAAVEVAPR